MPSLVLCYALADELIARQLGEFLTLNLALEVSYGECQLRPDRPGFDLVDAAERALSAEIALVLLSPHSVPKVWRRPRWEPVFLTKGAEFEARLAFVLVSECQYPKLFERETFFDVSVDFIAGARSIKRWLLRRDDVAKQPLLDDLLQRQIADQPGVAYDIPQDVAVTFIGACAADFESVYRIDATGRSRAGILGDLGDLLGLTLPESVDRNREALARECRDHRYLIAFENVPAADRRYLEFGGRASILFTSPSPATLPRPEEVQAVFFACPRDQRVCAARLGSADAHMKTLLTENFETGLRLGWAIVGVLKSAQRIAELVETLEWMRTAALRREDAPALRNIEWELSWLRDDSEGGISAVIPAPCEQLTLRFA